MSVFFTACGVLGGMCVAVILALTINSYYDFRTCWHYTVKYLFPQYMPDKEKEALHLTWNEFLQFSSYFPERYIYCKPSVSSAYNNPDYIHNGLDNDPFLPSWIYYLNDNNVMIPIMFDTYIDWLRFRHYCNQCDKMKVKNIINNKKNKQNDLKISMLTELQNEVIKKQNEANAQMQQAVNTMHTMEGIALTI